MFVKIPNYKERASTIFVTGLNKKIPGGAGIFKSFTASNKVPRAARGSILWFAHLKVFRFSWRVRYHS